MANKDAIIEGVDIYARGGRMLPAAREVVRYDNACAWQNWYDGKRGGLGL